MCVCVCVLESEPLCSIGKTIVADCQLFPCNGQSGESGKPSAGRLGCEIHKNARRLVVRSYCGISLSNPCPSRAVSQRGGAEEVARVRGAVCAGALPGEGGRAAVFQRRAHPCHLRQVRPARCPLRASGWRAPPLQSGVVPPKSI